MSNAFVFWIQSILVHKYCTGDIDSERSNSIREKHEVNSYPFQQNKQSSNGQRRLDGENS